MRILGLGEEQFALLSGLYVPKMIMAWCACRENKLSPTALYKRWAWQYTASTIEGVLPCSGLTIVRSTYALGGSHEQS